MKGFIKIDCLSDGIQIEVNMEDVSVMDKGQLVNCVLDGLGVDAVEWSALKAMIDHDMFNPKVKRTKEKNSIDDLMSKLFDTCSSRDEPEPVQLARDMGLEVSDVPGGAMIGGSKEQLMDFLKGIGGSKHEG